MDPEVLLIDTAIGAAEAILGNLKKTNITTNLGLALESGQAFIDALLAHKNDLLTKANFEAQRG